MPVTRKTSNILRGEPAMIVKNLDLEALAEGNVTFESTIGITNGANITIANVWEESEYDGKRGNTKNDAFIISSSPIATANVKQVDEEFAELFQSAVSDAVSIPDNTVISWNHGTMCDKYWDNIAFFLKNKCGRRVLIILHNVLNKSEEIAFDLTYNEDVEIPMEFAAHYDDIDTDQVPITLIIENEVINTTTADVESGKLSFYQKYIKDKLASAKETSNE